MNFLSILGFIGTVWLLSNFKINVVGIEIPPISFLQAIFSGLVIYLLSGGHYTLWLIYKTLPRDLRVLFRYFGLKRKVANALRNDLTIVKMFTSNVAKNPNKIAFICEDARWSFADMDDYSNRVAHYLLKLGLKRNDSVAIFMENKPEFVAIWLGCAKIGVVSALINSNLRQAPLVHSITIVDSKLVICGSELQTALYDVCNQLKGIPVAIVGSLSKNSVEAGYADLEECLSKTSASPVAEMDLGKFTDSLLYVYTSGTTGLPKAAIIKNARFMMFASGVNHLLRISDQEIIYNPLPLYHTAGGMIGVGQVLIHNCTCVIKKKFSVSQFWTDVVKNNCNVAVYVGEICRYLLNAPRRPEETQHKLRLMTGNGLRAEIWNEFVERFKVPFMAENYGATEGIANIMNVEGKPGACGFVSVLFPSAYPARLIKIDPESEQPVRGENGLCLTCKPGEPGEFVGKVRKDPAGEFHGYADKEASKRKIVRDVFSKGDSAFLSGDLMVMDELGYIYFRDRLGDTFRWRGENVSTTEVESVISRLCSHRDAVVFGVQVPHVEGKAGMAVIVDPKGDFDVQKLATEMQSILPPYARPIFVRIVNEIDTTGTFKLKKKALQKEGFDVVLKEGCDDLVYFWDAKTKSFVALTQDVLRSIREGQAGL